MADWTRGSLTACAGVISSCLMLGKGIPIGSGLLDVLAALGPLHLPPNIGGGKHLLTKQCSCPWLWFLVLVQPLLPLSGSGALDHERRESDQAVDSNDAETEVVVVVAVVSTDCGLLNRRYPLPGIGKCNTVVSKLITDRHFLWRKLISSTDTESCRQKNQFPLQTQVCGNVNRSLSFPIKIPS